jgi:hypothetical protein
MRGLIAFISTRKSEILASEHDGLCPLLGMRDAVSSVVWVPFLRDIASILADRYWKIDALEHFKSLKGRRYVIVDPYDAVILLLNEVFRGYTRPLGS